MLSLLKVSQTLASRKFLPGLRARHFFDSSITSSRLYDSKCFQTSQRAPKMFWDRCLFQDVYRICRSVRWRKYLKSDDLDSLMVQKPARRAHSGPRTNDYGPFCVRRAFVENNKIRLINFALDKLTPTAFFWYAQTYMN